jgi:hypothetical protein
MSGRRTINSGDLGTTEGITAAAAALATAVRDDVLLVVLDHTPPDRRQELFERFLCALCGIACAEIGPDGTKRALDEAKRAVDAVQAERRKKTQH